MMLRKLDHDPQEKALAQALRQQAEDLSGMIGDLDAFWGDRISKLVGTLVAWADALEARHGR
jgi:hypothetical protein